MDDSLVVRGGEPRGHAGGVLEGRAHRQRPAREQLAQRPPFQQLADDVGNAFVGADVVHRQDVWMVEAARGLRLVLEPPQPLGVADEAGGQHFDRHVPAQPRVARAVDFAHAPRAETGDDLVGTEAGAGRQRH